MERSRDGVRVNSFTCYFENYLNRDVNFPLNNFLDFICTAHRPVHSRNRPTDIPSIFSKPGSIKSARKIRNNLLNDVGG